jgi:hypothetical protein
MSIETIKTQFPSVGFPSVGVLWGEYTRGEIQEFLDWCVEHGAKAWESVLYDKRYDCFRGVPRNFFGVGCEQYTVVCNSPFYGKVVSTIEEAKEHISKKLGLEEQQEAIVSSGTPIKSDNLPIKSDGGSSAYYRFSITSSVTGETMEVETGDVIRHMVGNDFDLGNIIKACRRIHQAKQGKGKEGTDVEYDANKIAYFAEQIKKEV